MRHELDSFDVRILTLLQKDSSISSVQLAEKVGLSQAPCWRRVQRLKDEGYIRGTVAILEKSKLGIGVQIFAQLKVLSLSEQERDSFVKAIANTPEVVECYTTLGEMDVLIKVLADDMAAYDRFVFGTLKKLPGVVDVRSVVTLSEVKCTTSVPIPPSGRAG